MQLKQRENPVVLVTALGGDIGQAILRVLRDHPYTLIGVDTNPFCVLEDYCDAFYQVPFADKPDYVSCIKDICQAHSVDVIVPSSEQEISVLSGQELFLGNIKIAILSQNLLDVFFSKYKTAHFLKKLGIDVPKTARLKGFSGGIPYPLIAKPDSGRGSSGIVHLESDIDLEYYRAKELVDYVVQERIGSISAEYTTGVFSDGDLTYSISFQRKLVNGISQEVRLVEEPILDGIAQKIASATGFVGSMNIQSRKLGNRYYVFEVNPRISSTVKFRSMAGFEDAHWWVRCLLGLSVEYKPKVVEGVGVRFLIEKFVN